MDEIARIKKEIEDKKIELKRLEKQAANSERKKAIKSLSEYTDEEKISIFNKLYNSAEEMLAIVENKKYFNDDNKQYTWEEVMGILAKDNKAFWNYYNKFSQ